ncbi:MAG: hypothetical protein AMXMBFR13_36290 [Phycisphaerae bacterium]
MEISRKILFVDDEALLLDGIRRQLRKRYDLTTATGPEEGLRQVRESGPFAVVVSDYRMPGQNGAQFLGAVHELAPQSVLVMLTGQAELDVAVQALHQGHIFRFLNKPCETPLLESTLNECLEQYRLVVTEQLLRDELNRANAELSELNLNLEQLVARRTSTIRGLYGFVAELNGLDSLRDVAQATVTTAATMLGSRRVSLMLPDGSGEYLKIAASVGIEEEIAERVRVPVGTPIAGAVFKDGHSMVVNGDEPPLHPERYDTDIFASIPLASAALATPDGPVGVLNVTDRHDGASYDEESLETLRTISEAAAIAILNQIRREERDDARDATILALAKLAEHRDPETGAHLERVQAYCCLLSEALARTEKYKRLITGDFIQNLVRSSPLHDIGKVGIPDNVLLKPGRLTPDEFDIMKRHARIGGDTVRSLLDRRRKRTFLQMGMEIAYHHHEKFDGSGYPDGLVGEAIPLPARILAVADVYDALTSKRVYKPAMPHQKAADIIRGDSGKHFDPDMVAAFEAQEEQFRRLSELLADNAEAPPQEEMVESSR